MKTKKSLGQNFLQSSAVAKKLVESADITQNDVVVEVGPGKGIITNFLLQKASRVLAIEKDKQMIECLKEKFSQQISLGKLTLIHGDILEFSPRDYNLPPNTYTLIGAIPYYITGIFLRKFLSINEQPKTIALIVQKEVAERIVAKKNKASILSISIKAYGEVHYIQTVSRKLFSPEPSVDSAIISITSISKKNFKDMPEEMFFKIIKAGFGSKRKKLVNNIKTVPKHEFQKILRDLKISADIRAEDIAFLDWKKIAQKINHSAAYAEPSSLSKNLRYD